MPAYVIVFLESVNDPAELAEYRRIGAPSLAAAGGRFVVRGAPFDLLEGEAPTAVFVLEFPDMETARAWHSSPVYQEALTHRRRGARCRAVLVPGA
jgi:uncharacterized protein (DUF1330 family)